MLKLTANDFAYSFGIDSENMPEECLKLIDNLDFSYRVLEGKERDEAILSAIIRIREDNKVVGVPERTEVWQKGWNENLEAFIKSDYDLNSLMPRYYNDYSETVMRWKGDYIKSKNPNFVQEFFHVLTTWIFTRKLQ